MKSKTLTMEEMLALLDACPDTLKGHRDKALIVALWRGLMRIGATLRIMPDDIHWDQNFIVVRGDKYGSGRTVPIDKKAMEVLRTWMERRTSAGLNGVHPFFCTLHCDAFGRRISPDHFRRRLAKLGEMAGIEKRVHPHMLRHTGASMMYEEGVKIATISRVLGHKSISTTDTYLHEVRPDIANAELIERKWG